MNLSNGTPEHHFCSKMGEIFLLGNRIGEDFQTMDGQIAIKPAEGRREDLWTRRAH